MVKFSVRRSKCSIDIWHLECQSISFPTQGSVQDNSNSDKVKRKKKKDACYVYNRNKVALQTFHNIKCYHKDFNHWQIATPDAPLLENNPLQGCQSNSASLIYFPITAHPGVCVYSLIFYFPLTHSNVECLLLIHFSLIMKARCSGCM